MSYARYFKPGQKVLLRSLDPETPGRFEALSAYFRAGGAGHFDLTLPYRTRAEEAYPFAPEMPFELLTDAFGLGVRLTVRFRERLDGDLIRVAPEGDLEVFQRRNYRRLDTQAGLRFTRGQGTLRSFREQWEKNVRVLGGTPDLSRLPPFPRSRVNLSAGGIRFAVRPPVEVADLCLILLEIAPGQPPVCVLAEVVWLGEAEADGRHPAGMRFISILEADQRRIEALIRERGQPGSDERGAGS